VKREDFNGGWRFYKHGGSHAEFIDLPHDAMIHERRDPASEGGGAIGFFTGGVYIYEKDFFVPRQWEDKCVIFEFEGVYRNSKVYINDQEAGGRPYGYSNFYVNADPFLNMDRKTPSGWLLTIPSCPTAGGIAEAAFIGPSS